jgi:hypothetical protein
MMIPFLLFPFSSTFFSLLLSKSISSCFTRYYTNVWLFLFLFSAIDVPTRHYVFKITLSPSVSLSPQTHSLF